MDTQSTLGKALVKGLIGLREQKGELTIEDVGALLSQTASALQASTGLADKFFKDEITKLASFIHQAKEEVCMLGGSTGPESTGKDVSDNLGAIVKGTEEASNIIMDAADKIQLLAGSIEGETAKQIVDETSKIYEACNFQDLTGQRITKVINYLAEIDERIEKIVTLFGAVPMVAAATSDQPNVINVNFDEKNLLNGPATGAAPTQADIDALFASFKP